MSFLRICFFFVVCISWMTGSGYAVEKAKIVSRTSIAEPPKKKVTSPQKSLVNKAVPQPIRSSKTRSQASSSIKGIKSNKKPSSKSAPLKATPLKQVLPNPAPPKLVSPKPVSENPASLELVSSKPVSPKLTSPVPLQQAPPPVSGISKATPKQDPKIPILKDQKLIVIDAGHGGYDLGARISSCDEKSLALSTALLTKKYLTDLGYRVILTRSRDVFIPLEKRALIANETKSKLFVSIHYNSAPNPVAKGIEVFYYASEDKIRKDASKKLATRVLSKVVDRTAAESRGTKEGKFCVIRETKMPAILIEAGFMTHPDELHLLKDINYRDKIARGIAEGIDSYFKL